MFNFRRTKEDYEIKNAQLEEHVKELLTEIEILQKDISVSKKNYLKTLNDKIARIAELEEKLKLSRKPSLDKAIIKEIEKLYEYGWSHEQIANQVKVSKSSVSKYVSIYLAGQGKLQDKPVSPRFTVIDNDVQYQ